MTELGHTHNALDLVPGRPEAIEENLAVLRSRADYADASATGLLAIDARSWTGPAANAFRDKYGAEPRRWFTAANALEAAADSLGDYAAVLRWAQAQAVEAIARYDRGDAATTQAKAVHDQATAQANAHNLATPPFVDPGEPDRQAARDILARARAQLAEAGLSAASILDDEAGTAPRKSSWLDDLGHALEHAGANVVNGLASFGNAMVHHPGDVAAAVGGAGLTMASSAGEVVGGVLDATGIGSVAGVPITIASTAGIATGATMTAGAVTDMAIHAAGDDHVEVINTRNGGSTPPATATPTPAEGMADLFDNGKTPTASDLERYAQEQGWTKTKTPTGPRKYIDGNGVERMVLKSGSARTPGSEGPHVALKDEYGKRIDPAGNYVARNSDGNHTPIRWDM